MAAFLMFGPIHILFSLLVLAVLIPRSICNQPCLVPNCLFCPANPYTCASCPTSSSVSANPQCCQPQCSTCLNQTLCQSCTSGYTLNHDNSLCYLSNSCTQTGCVSCNQQNTCSLCLSGMVLNEYTRECMLCPQLCMVCDVWLNCLECELFHYYNKNTNSCEYCQMQGCLACTAPLNCLKCDSGLVLAAQFPVCNTCPNHCQFCTNESSCVVCQPGFYLQSTPISRCKPCASTCSNCTGNSTNCTSCTNDAFYNSTDNSCVPCSVAIPMCMFCTTLNQTTIQCLACVAEMWIDSPNNSCRKCPNGCLTCNNMAICTSCMNGYYLENTTIVNTTINVSENVTICAPCMAHCVQCSNNYTCETCAAYYYQQNSSKYACVACPQFCIQFYYVNNTCKYCNPGYYSFESQCAPCMAGCGTCTNNPNNCTQCLKSSFYLQTIITGIDQTKTIVCLPCPLYCKQCQNATMCQQCVGGSVLDGALNQCIKCGVEHCYGCELGTASTLCNLCASGYYLGMGGISCLMCNVSNCVICGDNNNSNSCLGCGEGFWLTQTSNQCLPCPNYCSECFNASICQQCIQKYYLITSNNNNNNQSLCLPCAYGCLYCLSYALCIQCIDGFYVSIVQHSGQAMCHKCNQSCLVCVNQNICTLCVSGYRMGENGQCWACPGHCLNCDYRGNCQTCEDGYAPVLSISNDKMVIQCSQCPTPCQKCTTIISSFLNLTYFHCIQCPSNQVLLQNNTCFHCGTSRSTSGCLSCNQYAECVSCQTGYNFTWTTSTGGVCLNGNTQVVYLPFWGLIWWCVGLGCTLIVLIGVLVWMRLSFKERTMGRYAEMRMKN